MRRYGPYVHKRLGYRYFVVKHDDGRREFIYEHREVVANQLGRALEPDEVVHHGNTRKDDNRPENLEVKSRAAHTSEHAKPAPTVERVCPWCLKVFVRFERDVRYSDSQKKRTFCSKSCAAYFQHNAPVV